MPACPGVARGEVGLADVEVGVEVGRRAGARAYLIDDAEGLDLAWLAGVAVVGVTAGASAPEVLVQGVIARLSRSFEVSVEEIDAERETVSFKLPRVLA